MISPGWFLLLCTHQVCPSPAVAPCRWHMMLLNRRTSSQRGLLGCSYYKGEQNLLYDSQHDAYVCRSHWFVVYFLSREEVFTTYRFQHTHFLEATKGIKETLWWIFFPLVIAIHYRDSCKAYLYSDFELENRGKDSIIEKNFWGASQAFAKQWSSSWWLSMPHVLDMTDPALNLGWPVTLLFFFFSTPCLRQLNFIYK